MLNEIPVWVQVTSAAVSVGGAMFAVYKSGQAQAIRQNGYVKRDDCHRRTDEILDKVKHTDENVTRLFGRVDEQGKSISNIEGYLEGMGR